MCTLIKTRLQKLSAILPKYYIAETTLWLGELDCQAPVKTTLLARLRIAILQYDKKKANIVDILIILW